VQWLERFRQAGQMVWHPGDLDLGSRKIEIGRHNEQRFAFCGKDSFGNRCVAQQWFIRTSLLYCLQPKRAGGVRLWIKIDNQNAPAELRQRSAEVYGRGRFADATFLICDRDDFHSLLRIFQVCGTCMMMLPVAGNEN